LVTISGLIAYIRFEVRQVLQESIAAQPQDEGNDV